MIIKLNSSLPAHPLQSSALNSLFRDKANRIKDHRFRVSIYDNSLQPSRKNNEPHSFSNMFRKITKQIKTEIREEKRADLAKQTKNVGSDLHLCLNSIKEPKPSPLPNDNSSKVKTALSEPRFSYSQVQFTTKPNLSKRKMTATNLSDRICKGSTFSRLTNFDQRLNQPIPKTKTEAEVEPADDFAPIGHVQANNNSYRYLKDFKPPAQAHSCNISEPEEEPLRQIYDKIFIKYQHPERPQQEIRRRNNRNIRRLYSSYKMNSEKNRDSEKDTQKSNYVSNKVMKPSPHVQPHRLDRQESLSSGNTLGPWAQQKYC